MPGKLSLTNDCTYNAKEILGTNLCKKYNLCSVFLICNYHHMSKMCNISVEQTPEEGTNGATIGNNGTHLFTYIFCRAPARWSWIIHDFSLNNSWIIFMKCSWNVHEDAMNLLLDILKSWIFIHKKKVDEFSWIYFFMNNSWIVIFMKIHHFKNVQ